MFKYLDVTITFGVFIAALLAVIAPFAWAYLCPNPVYISPVLLGEFVRFGRKMSKEDKEKHKNGYVEKMNKDEDSDSARLKKDMHDVLKSLIEKNPKEEDFIKAMMEIDSTYKPVNYLIDNSIVHFDPVKYPLLSAFLRIFYEYVLKKDIKMDKIKEYVLKQYKFDEYKAKKGGDVSIEEFFEEKVKGTFFDMMKKRKNDMDEELRNNRWNY